MALPLECNRSHTPRTQLGSTFLGCSRASSIPHCTFPGTCLHMPFKRRLQARQPVEQPQFPEEQIQSLRAWNVFPSSVIRSGWTPWYLMHCTPSIVIQGHFCLVGRLFCLEWMDAPWILSLTALLRDSQHLYAIRSSFPQIFFSTCSVLDPVLSVRSEIFNWHTLPHVGDRAIVL